MTTTALPLAGASRSRAALLLALALAVAWALVAAPAARAQTSSGNASVTRLTAQDNIGASIAWSTITFADGTARRALLARDDVFADSLASGGAQAAFDAPLLLTRRDVLDPRTLAELRRLGVRRVTVLGGEQAVRPAVATALQSAGFTVDRLSGPTRTETAIAVAEAAFPNATNVIVARGFASGADPTQAFADTIATGAFAAGANTPVLFTETGRLTATTRAYLDREGVVFATVAGGTDAVSDPVLAAIRSLGIDATRASGANRFATAVGMSAARNLTSAAESTRVILVEGQSERSWASGFPAAIQSAGRGAPVVLANGDALPEETRAFLADGRGRIPLICGPFTTAAACTAAAQALGL